MRNIPSFSAALTLAVRIELVSLSPLSRDRKLPTELPRSPCRRLVCLSIPSADSTFLLNKATPYRHIAIRRVQYLSTLTCKGQKKFQERRCFLMICIWSSLRPKFLISERRGQPRRAVLGFPGGNCAVPYLYFYDCGCEIAAASHGNFTVKVACTLTLRKI
jgi:hypothetical protein